MATIGYFTIVSTEKKDSDPYIGKEDILVEAYHDGYFQDMLNDVLNVTFVIGKKLAKGEIKKTFEEKYNEICSMQSSLGIIKLHRKKNVTFLNKFRYNNIIN
jgi:hypothetical protein